jgi:hypothetical protein
VLAAGCQDCCLELAWVPEAIREAGHFDAFTCHHECLFSSLTSRCQVESDFTYDHVYQYTQSHLARTELESGQMKARMHGRLKPRTWRSALVTLRIAKEEGRNRTCCL